MRNELETELKTTYPNLYAKLDWGLDVGDGWYNIIAAISPTLENEGVQAVQVKEKFGGLRFYIDGGGWSNTTEAVIRVAETLAWFTCEICGCKGEMVKDNGWYKTRCGTCD